MADFKITQPGRVEISNLPQMLSTWTRCWPSGIVIHGYNDVASLRRQDSQRHF